MRVALFVTCLTDTFYPRVGVAVVRVLRHFGCRVEFPEGQTCCGQPAYNSGFHAEARAAARRLIGCFEGCEHVVTPSASCAAMVRDHYPELLASDAAWHRRAVSLARRVRELTEFLRDVLGVDTAPLLHIAEDVTLHYPCHARGVVAHEALASLLTAAAGPRFRPAPAADVCCGFGGVFGVEMPEISAAMMQDKLAALRDSGARTVVCNEGGCTLHLAGGAHRAGVSLRFVHLAELLAESLGLLPVEPREDGG